MREETHRGGIDVVVGVAAKTVHAHSWRLGSVERGKGRGMAREVRLARGHRLSRGKAGWAHATQGRKLGGGGGKKVEEERGAWAAWH